MRIDRWARVGMLLTGAWIVAATIGLTFADLRIARFLRYLAFEVCDYINYHVCHCGNCWRDLMVVAALVDRPVINFALIALAPVIFAGVCARLAARAYQG